ncbi:MAG: DUF4276 family protein [bacterium]|nr:DUF4276 family protein [bacterium]
MTKPHLEFLVEEPSMEACLQNILPKVINEKATFRIHPFQGKMDLLSNLSKRLRGYARWLPAHYRIFIIVDRDNQDCHELKSLLEQIVIDSGLVSRSQNRNAWQIVTRIVIEELEAWFFGDMDAVRAAFRGLPLTLERKRKYRDPDAVVGGTQEAFEREVKKAGYYKNGLRKIEAARVISENMEPFRNRSHSFQVLYNTLNEVIS